jgi:hypothetical protein
VCKSDENNVTVLENTEGETSAFSSITPFLPYILSFSHLYSSKSAYTAQKPVLPVILQKKTTQLLLEHFSNMLKPLDNNDPEAPDYEITDELLNTFANISSRFTELTTERLNRLPEKMGMQLMNYAAKELFPLNPAQLPVKFTLTESAKQRNILIPSGVQVSNQGTENKDPIIFETRYALDVVKPDLDKLITVDFTESKMGDKSHLIEQLSTNEEKLYDTDKDLTYKMHLYDPVLEDMGKGIETGNKTAYHWLQVVLNFANGDVGPAVGNLGTNDDVFTPENYGAVDIDRDQELDIKLFDIKLKYAVGENEFKEYVIKDTDKGIRSLNNEEEEIDTEVIDAETGESIETTITRQNVFFLPVKIDQPIYSRTIRGFAPAEGQTVSYTKPFVTVEMTVRNKEYFNLFQPPVLMDAGFKIFYRPDTDINDVMDLAVESDGKTILPSLQPPFRNMINVEHVFCNDSVPDISTPIKPFGETPEVGSTFYFSSIFFSRAGETCEIDLWVQGDLNPDVPDDRRPFMHENDAALKPDTENILLGWEYFDGKEWILFARSGIDEDEGFSSEDLLNEPSEFVDYSHAFTRSACFSQYDENAPFIQFKVPPMQKTEVNGIEDWWIRVRLLNGNYGGEIKFVYDNNSDEYIPKQEPFLPPIFRTFTVNYSVDARHEDLPYSGFPMIKSETILSENDFSLRAYRDKTREIETPSGGFPLMELNSDFSRDYLNTERVLYLGFDGDDIPGKPETLFFSLQTEQTMLIREEELTESTSASETSDDKIHKLVTKDIKNTTPALKWEYWSGNPVKVGLGTLVVDTDSWRKLEVNDRTNNLTSDQSVEFVIPSGAGKRLLLGRELYWVRITVPKRVRIKQIESSATLFRSATPPIAVERALLKEKATTFNDQIRLKGLNQNMVLADSVETIRNKSLGSSTGGPDQVFQLPSAPVLKGVKILVQETDLPSETAQTLIRNEVGDDAIQEITSANGEIEVWVRWIEVSDFIYSGPGDRHYMLNHATGLISFGDGTHGRIPDMGTNNIKVEEYRFGIGDDANLGVDEVNTIVSAVPYVDRVTNVGEGRGGTDMETVNQKISLGPVSLRNRGSATAKEDYDVLSLGSPGGVMSVKTYGSQRADGVTDSQGWVSVVVNTNQHNAKPMPNGEIIASVKSYLADRADCTMVNRLPQFNPAGFIAPPEIPDSDALDTKPTEPNSPYLPLYVDKLHVVPPNYIKTWVETNIVVEEGANRIDTIEAVRKRLNEYLHVGTGGDAGEGWDFGENVREDKVSAIILGVKGVKHLKTVEVNASQMKFTLPLDKRQLEDLEPDNDRPESNSVYKGAEVNVTYKGYVPNVVPERHETGLNMGMIKTDSNGVIYKENKDFKFSFFLGRDLYRDDQDVVLEGFKEGDIITFKTEINASQRTCFAKKYDSKLVSESYEERVIGRTRVLGAWPVGFSDDDRNISYYRLKMEPFSLELPGRVDIVKKPDVTILVPTNTLPSNAFITAEVLRGEDSVKTPVTMVKTFVKQFHSSEGKTFAREGEPELKKDGLDFSDIFHEKFVMIDVAIPNGFIKAAEKDVSLLTMDILPRDNKVLVWQQGQEPANMSFPFAEERRGLSYDYRMRNVTNVYYTLHEYNGQTFFRFSDLPYAGRHVVKAE